MTEQKALKLSNFDKWKQGIDQAASNPKWGEWDCEIQRAVNEYNNHLADTEGYVRLDWHYIKAMIWVESGAGSPAWRTNPIQIGNAGDPGLKALLTDKDGKDKDHYEGGDLVMPPGLKEQLQLASVNSIPSRNIRAGIGYLLMKMMSYKYRSVTTDNKIYTVEVKPGNNSSVIAKEQGTTLFILEKLNPKINIHKLHPGMTLKYQKASMQYIITDWQPISTALITKLYNGGGDADYKRKLDYVWPLIHSRSAAICEQ